MFLTKRALKWIQKCLDMLQRPGRSFSFLALLGIAYLSYRLGEGTSIFYSIPDPSTSVAGFLIVVTIAVFIGLSIYMSFKRPLDRK